MQDVFRLVQSRKVAAGLVNTYFGWRNAAEYGLRETRVLVRPSLLYIAAVPSADASLLATIDDYLTAWKQDRDSIYHQALARWLLPAEGGQVKRWLYWIAGLALLLLGLVVVLVLLVRQLVKSKTAELEQKTDRLDHLAHHDPLTELPNRLLFFDRLKHSIRQSHRQGTNLALLFSISTSSSRSTIPTGTEWVMSCSRRWRNGCARQCVKPTPLPGSAETSSP